VRISPPRLDNTPDLHCFALVPTTGLTAIIETSLAPLRTVLVAHVRRCSLLPNSTIDMFRKNRNKKNIFNAWHFLNETGWKLEYHYTPVFCPWMSWLLGAVGVRSVCGRTTVLMASVKPHQQGSLQFLTAELEDDKDAVFVTQVPSYQ
jgi:hypothetical protein